MIELTQIINNGTVNGDSLKRTIWLRVSSIEMISAFVTKIEASVGGKSILSLTNGKAILVCEEVPRVLDLIEQHEWEESGKKGKRLV